MSNQCFGSLAGMIASMPTQAFRMAYDSQIHFENNYSGSSNNNNYLKTNNNTNFPNSNSNNKTCERCKSLEAKIDDLNTKFDNMLDYLKKMMEVQAKQGAQLSVLANKHADMRNLSKLFPIKTIEEMESVNNAINEVNINEYEDCRRRQKSPISNYRNASILLKKGCID
ncbi:rac guanine nucleotide exchange factor B-like [Bactrocera tryoni]|uniref:rac guanine nucleotide exchange factor B-like n=1 Tax=Bactrocera tryoni TaxID=59916 RepID=UPI001A973A5C|nr:rac guanine nucleotide exchange factor B-like [Bactrocera tryoni]